MRASPLHLKPASPGAAATATAATRTILTTSARAPPPFPQSATQPRKAPLLLLPPTSLLTALSSRLYNDIIFMAHAPPGGNKGVAAAVYLYIHRCVCVYVCGCCTRKTGTRGRDRTRVNNISGQEKWRGQEGRDRGKFAIFFPSSRGCMCVVCRPTVIS